MIASASPRTRFWAALIALIALSGSILAQTTSVNLAWNPSASPSAIDYQVSYGLASGVYTAVVDAGDNTNVNISGLTPGLTYYFAVSAYDSNGDESPFSNEISDSLPVLPIIVAAPVSQTAIAGATVVFSVTATSSAAMTFQWFDGANALPGATNASLTLASVADANDGSYSVVVANSSGIVTSAAATLSVIDPPTITLQPVSQSVGVGTEVLFHVGNSGTPPFTFQWFANGQPLPSAQKKTLCLPSVTAANAGNYYVSVGNSAGIAVSATVNLIMTNPFAPLAGTYNGLFYQVGGTNVHVKYNTTGMLNNCVVGANGAYSATVYSSGYSYPLAGQLNASGADAEIVVRTNNGLTNLLVSLQLDMTGVSQSITGTVSNMTFPGWAAPLVANLATNALPVPPASIVLTVPPMPTSPNSPTGDGLLVVTVAGDIASITGYLYDGALVTESVPIAGDGFIPVYSGLYGGLGLIEGWIDLAGGAANGWLTWICPAGANTNSALSYSAGFTNSNITIGSGL